MQRSLSRKAEYVEGSKNKLSKKQSKNYYKNKNRLNKEQNKTKNKRKDTINKIVHYLTSNYDIVVTQKDNISGWKHLFGKRIESTGIGGIIDALKHKASTLILLDRFIPTTKECSNCHNKYNIKLDERIYQCTNCGFIIDRDYNSALNDMYYGIIKLNELLKIKNIKFYHRNKWYPSAKLSVAANVRYINHVPVISWNNAFPLPHTGEWNKLAGISFRYISASNMNSIVTGISWPSPKITAQIMDIQRNPTAINPSTVVSAPLYLLYPSANQCTP